MAGGHTDKCNPGHQHTKENREGQITITSRATDTRRSVTSLNTDGPELTTSLEQTRAEDLEIYTLHWCEQLNQLASPNDLPVYWMAPQETPSHLISLCTDNEADRFEPFTAANYPSAVRNLVDRMMAREYR